MKLNTIADNKGARKNRMRVGRGIGSGKGKTCGHGGKGQESRTGVSLTRTEGGQMPLARRLPKRGFNNIHKITFQTVNFNRLVEAITRHSFDISKLIDREALQALGLIKTLVNPVAILATGELKLKLNLSVDRASQKALEIVEKAGGKLTLAR